MTVAMIMLLIKCFWHFFVGLCLINIIWTNDFALGGTRTRLNDLVFGGSIETVDPYEQTHDQPQTEEGDTCHLGTDRHPDGLRLLFGTIVSVL